MLLQFLNSHNLGSLIFFLRITWVLSSRDRKITYNAVVGGKHEMRYAFLIFKIREDSSKVRTSSFARTLEQWITPGTF